MIPLSNDPAPETIVEKRRGSSRDLPETTGWKCKACGNTIKLDEKQAYDASGLCTSCEKK